MGPASVPDFVAQSPTSFFETRRRRRDVDPDANQCRADALQNAAARVKRRLPAVHNDSECSVVV